MDYSSARFVGVAASALFFLLCAPAAWASCVNPGGTGSCFGTIQAAVDAAGPGEKITVRSGTYFENVVIPAGKDGLQIVGAGSRKKVVLDPDAPNSGPGIVIRSPGVLVKNLTIKNGENDGIRVEAGGAGSTIERIDMFGPNHECVDVSADSVRVLRNRLYGCDTGIWVETGGSNVEIDRNLVYICDANCVTVTENGATITRNTIIQAEDGNGIEVVGDGFVVKNNLSFLNDNDAFTIHCTPCTEGGVVENNRGRGGVGNNSGFEVYADAPGLVVRRNLAETNSDEGYYVGGTGVVLEKNIARWNGGDQTEHGYLIEGSDHQLTGNVSFFSIQDGFRILASNTTLDGNLATRNIGDGFDVDVSDPVDSVTLQNNRALDNIGLGIEISSGVTNTVVENNTAKRNRTDFCDEATGTTETGNSFDTTGACAIDD